MGAAGAAADPAHCMTHIGNDAGTESHAHVIPGVVKTIFGCSSAMAVSSRTI